VGVFISGDGELLSDRQVSVRLVEFGLEHQTSGGTGNLQEESGDNPIDSAEMEPEHTRIGCGTIPQHP
jgi:hypothetical protein